MFGWFKKKKGKVFVGLSGGVDSAVSAALLVREGYDVTGVFIRIVVPGYPCTAGDDKRDALRVAAHLKIPFLELDLSKEYEQEVFQNTIEGYKRGQTPNPDTLCNKEIKFGRFYDFAKSKGADFIATGHYARNATSVPSLVRSGPLGQVQHSLQEPKLLTGLDKDKDQSYFLWMVREEILKDVLFPVGGMEKSQVRILAEKFGLPNAARKDSQGLCFLGPISIDEMLTQELNPVRGEVLDEDGRPVGMHNGAVLYTLGQRHGFELTLQNPDTQPHYVIGKDLANNTITVSTNKFPRDSKETVVTLRDTNWIGDVRSGTYTARYRYRQPLIGALLHDNKVILTEPVYAPLGQSLVLYNGENCLGGGVIEAVEYR